MKLKFVLGLTTAASLLSFGALANAEEMWGLTNAGLLVSFDSASPSTFTSSVSLTGVSANEVLRAIDVRPSTGEVYAVSSRNSTTNGTATIYRVNTTTGALTVVGSQFSFLAGLNRLSLDFEPQNDFLTLISAGTGTGTTRALSRAINPTTGAVTNLSNIVDSTGANVFVAGIAYNNNVVGAPSTTLFGYDFNNDEIGTINTTTGLFTSIGASGIVTNSASMGMDISGATGIAYLVADTDDFTGGTIDDLFTVNLTTGAVSHVASFGVEMLDISAKVNPVPEPATLAALGLGVAALARRRLR